MFAIGVAVDLARGIIDDTSLLTLSILNLGMGFRPMPDMDDVESTLIYFYHGDHHTNWKPWVDRLDVYLEGKRSMDIINFSESCTELTLSLS